MARKQHALNRRRGAASRGTSVHQPLYSSIKALFCIAITLTTAMLTLFMFYMPSSVNHNDPSNFRKKHLPGLPHMFRGNVQKVAVPPPSAQQPKSLKDADKQAEQAALKARKQLQADEEKAESADDDLAADDAVAAKQKAIRERAKMDKTRKKWEEQEKDRGKVPQETDGELKLDLNRYDGPPTRDYPYPLEVVSPDYDIHEQFTPSGGMRYSEYTTGGTPYVVTDAMKQKSDDVARSRRAYVKKTMEYGWGGYVRYAFGQDEVKPQTKQGNNNWGGQGITLVDSLDTLWLMGMKDEFYQARDWVRDNLHHDHVHSVSVFETTIRDLGGLLAAYDWSRDKVFLDKALELGERLIKAFDGSTTGIPSGMVDLATGRTSNVGWAGGNVIIAECGTLQIENRYLTKLTGKPEFAQKTEHVFDVLKEISPENGLFPYYIRNGRSGKPSFANNKLTFGAMADSLYEYMLKIWIQGGRREDSYREMYDKAIDSMHKELLQTSTPSHLVYIADKDGGGRGGIDHKMDHLVCFMGGLLALGAYTDPLGLESERAQRDLRTGKALAYTCYQMYARMNTGISPEFVQFYPGKDLQIGRGAPHYLLRPEAFESFFILNQLTGEPIYREWGWECFQSIEKYCKTGIGYGALSNVQDTSGKPRDSTESFFFAETLKYLYLLQDPDTEVDILHKHVFNTEAHPLRIFPVIDQESSAGNAIK